MGCGARLRVALRRARGTTARFRRGKKTTRKTRRSVSFRLVPSSSVSTANTTRSVPRTRRTVPRRRSHRVSIHPPFRTSLSAAPPRAPPRPTAATTPSPERASSSRVKVEADPPRIARRFDSVAFARPFSAWPFSSWPFSSWPFSSWPFSSWSFSSWPSRLSAVSSTARKMSCASATARSAASAGHAAARLRASSARRAHSAGFVDDTLL